MNKWKWRNEYLWNNTYVDLSLPPKSAYQRRFKAVQITRMLKRKSHTLGKVKFYHSICIDIFVWRQRLISLSQIIEVSYLTCSIQTCTVSLHVSVGLGNRVHEREYFSFLIFLCPVLEANILNIFYLDVAHNENIRFYLTCNIM